MPPDDVADWLRGRGGVNVRERVRAIDEAGSRGKGRARPRERADGDRGGGERKERVERVERVERAERVERVERVDSANARAEERWGAESVWGFTEGRRMVFREDGTVWGGEGRVGEVVAPSARPARVDRGEGGSLGLPRAPSGRYARVPDAEPAPVPHARSFESFDGANARFPAGPSFGRGDRVDRNDSTLGLSRVLSGRVPIAHSAAERPGFSRNTSDRGTFSRNASGRGGVSRNTSEQLPRTASDLGLGFERVTSEHFSRVGSGGTMVRSESATSAIAALRVTFMSVRSYGNTDQSSGSLIDDASGLVGGAFRSKWSSDDRGLGGGNGSRRSFRANWSAAAIGLPSKVEEAAGSLYRAGSIDKQWNIGIKIGEGAFSQVRLGEGRNMGGGRVAVKIVSKGAPDLFSPDGVCREVTACRLVGHHPNVVACIAVFEDDRFVYIVLELLTGGLLLPRIADTAHYYPRYCENDVVTVVRALTRGLDHSHSLGIAHRDVKPENILFVAESMDPTVKLTDFGIAHMSSNTTPATDMCGTPLYVAPEVLLRQPYGCAADMWSLGVITHILLVGYPPFDDDDLVQLINKVKHSPVRLNGEEWLVISEEGRDFVRKLLSRDLETRLSATQALRHSWLATPRPPPFPAPPPPTNSRQRNTPQPMSRASARPAQHRIGAVANYPLDVAQINLQSFVVRKEWKRIVEHDYPERSFKLSMLVSMSEKELQIPEVDSQTTSASASQVDSDSPSRAVRPTRVTSLGSNEPVAVNSAVATSQAAPSRPRAPPGSNSKQVSAGRPPKQTPPPPPIGTSSDTAADIHQRQQQRLRQQRLLLQAELSKKKKLKETEKESPSESSARSVTTVDSGPTESATSDGSHRGPIHESFRNRRDADAETDRSQLQQQRSEKLQRNSKYASVADESRGPLSRGAGGKGGKGGKNVKGGKGRPKQAFAIPALHVFRSLAHK